MIPISKFSLHTRNNIRFQLGCWEMQHNPYGMSEEGTLAMAQHGTMAPHGAFAEANWRRSLSLRMSRR